ncbi:hypothetical protein EON82_02840 [bacterium]|nr:MAG: hypothetical protein EON82_02840 [bacterium]
MQPNLPDELVERSLKAAVAFADATMPMVAAAFEFAAETSRLRPLEGARVDEASLQLLPNLFRYGLISLVEAHNRREGTAGIRRKGSPNNGLWLGIAGTEEMARVYKVSKRYNVRPSGNAQERLITQARYRQLLIQPELYEVGEVRLDALLMWQSKGFELTGAYVVIPNGWDEERNLVTVGQAEVVLPDTLGDIATFGGAEEDTTLIRGDMPIFSPASMVEEEDDVPYEDDEGLGGLFGSPDEEIMEPSDLSDDEPRQ